MLRATVADAIEQGSSAADLAHAIGESAGFSDYRSMMIARTEIVNANRQGNVTAYRESGAATGKEWLTAGDDLVDDECQENEDAGPIGLDEDFPNGDLPHPSCRCDILPVVEPLSEAKE